MRVTPPGRKRDRDARAIARNRPLRSADFPWKRWTSGRRGPGVDQPEETNGKQNFFRPCGGNTIRRAFNPATRGSGQSFGMGGLAQVAGTVVGRVLQSRRLGSERGKTRGFITGVAARGVMMPERHGGDAKHADRQHGEGTRDEQRLVQHNQRTRMGSSIGSYPTAPAECKSAPAARTTISHEVPPREPISCLNAPGLRFPKGQCTTRSAAPRGEKARRGGCGRHRDNRR